MQFSLDEDDFPLYNRNAALNKAEGEARYEQAFHRAEAVLPLCFSKHPRHDWRLCLHPRRHLLYRTGAGGGRHRRPEPRPACLFADFALGAMLATGAATRFALERHEGKHADGYLAEALTWAGILSVPFILLGIFSAEGIVRLLGGEPDIVTVARRIHAFSCSSRPSSCATTSCAPSSSTTAIRRLP